jgi:peptidoglycan/xylan/chitin deacetylase (PgdA/CDA1 family)
MNVAIVFAVFAMTASSVCFGQLSSVPISGGNLPLCPRCIVISIDDLPYNRWQSGPADPPSWTLAYFQYLHLVRRVERGVLKRGVPALAFVVGCHFSGQPLPPPPPESVMCMGPQDQDESLIGQLVQMGFVCGSHSQNHIPASLLNLVSSGADLRNMAFVSELSETQRILDRWVLQEDPKYFRAPGLDSPDWTAPVANSDPYLASRKLIGPIGVDIGGAFDLGDGNWMGGDVDCFAKTLTPRQCADLYLRDTRNNTSVFGAFVLFHNYVIPGSYAMELIKDYIEGLPSDIVILDPLNLSVQPLFRGPKRFPAYRP